MVRAVHLIVKCRWFNSNLASLFFHFWEVFIIKVLDKGKILDFMKQRKDILDEQVFRDFSGGMTERVSEQREVKWWQEAIERGEFDTELQEIYVILSATHPELADFTFYDNEEEAKQRVADLNELAKRREYWYITLYSNLRNSEND